MSCNKPSCSSGSTEINTDWCTDTSAGCSTCTPVSACENHSATTIIKNFDTTVKVDNSWAVPNCGGSAILSISCLTNILVGSYLWSPSYGYFKVIAYNPVTNKITVENDCLLPNAAPGTSIAAGTLFVVGDSPFNLEVSCTALTLPVNLAIGTDTYTFSVGDSSIFSVYQTLQLAGRTDYFFLISGIPNSTQVQVSVYPPISANSTVAAGSSVCTYIPCNNYEYRPTAQKSTGNTLGAKVLQNSDTIFTSNAEDVAVNNASQCRGMTVVWNATAIVEAIGANASTHAFDITLELLYAEGSGSYSSIAAFRKTWHEVGDGNHYEDMQISANGTLSTQVVPLATGTVHFKIRCTFSGTAGSTYTISGCHVNATLIGVNHDNS